MTVHDMEERMPNAEYVRWSMFLAQRAAEQEVEAKMAERRA